MRLLHTYSSFELASECQPPRCAPPGYWKEGRGRAKVEKVFIAGAFTLFIRVSPACLFRYVVVGLMRFERLGRVVG